MDGFSEIGDSMCLMHPEDIHTFLTSNKNFSSVKAWLHKYLQFSEPILHVVVEDHLHMTGLTNLLNIIRVA